MASVGADVEQLRALAQLFGDKATSLEDVVNTINGQLHSAGWVGEDADAFKSDWDSNLTVLVRNVVDSLRERNTSLNQQADEQEKASAVNGSISGAKGVGSIAKSGSGGSGSDPYNGKPREGEAGRDADYARLAQAAYETGDPIPDGWRKVDAEELKKLGIDPSELDTANGMQASVYQNADGKYVVAFRGTELGLTVEGLKDVAADVKGAAGVSHQVEDAMNLSTKLAQAVGRENVDFTGHSLGGELASAAALATGGAAVTFNAAGLSETSQAIARGKCIDNFGYDAQAPMDGSNVKAYSYELDPLNNFQDDMHANPLTFRDKSIPRAYGERHIVQADFITKISPHNPIDYHHMDYLYGPLDAQYENPKANHIAASGTPTTNIGRAYVQQGIASGTASIVGGAAQGSADITSGVNDATQHLATSGARAANAWNRGDYVGAAGESAAGAAQATGDFVGGVAKGTGEAVGGMIQGGAEILHGYKRGLVGGE
mgnify:FL=1